MNTTPLQSPASILPNPPPATRSGDAGAPQVPFNQVLSQEVAQRNDANQAKDNADSQAAAPKTTAGGNGAPPANAENDTKTAADAADSTAKDGQPVTAISAELLALVASLQRPAGAAAAAVTAVAATAAVAPPAGIPGIDAAIAARTAGSSGAHTKDTALAADAGNPSNGDAALTAAADGTTTAGNSAAQKPAGAGKAEAAFAAAVQQASEAKPAPDAALQKILEQALETTPAPAIAQLAPVIAQAAPGAVVPAADRLTPAVGTPAWDSALGQKVVWMVAGAQQSASLTLNPPDLGPLQVVLHVSNSQANATFISAQPEVRQALEAAMPRLREMMSDAGIQLGQASVGTSMPNQQQAPGEQAPRHASRGLEPVRGNSESTLPPPVSSSGRGMVDTFV